MASGCYPLVKMLDDYFVSIGLVRKEGNIVDATFLRANSRPTKHEDKKTDIDAEFGRRGDIRRLRKCLSSTALRGNDNKCWNEAGETYGQRVL